MVLFLKGYQTFGDEVNNYCQYPFAKWKGADTAEYALRTVIFLQGEIMEENPTNKSTIGNENYISVQGWMINELHLKGNELLIYACIYGFSQKDDQVFNGGLKYLADWTSSTKQGVIKCLKSLQEKGYISKEEHFINRVKVCEYRSTKFNGGIKLSLPNNIEDNKKENYTKESSAHAISVDAVCKCIRAYYQKYGYGKRFDKTATSKKLRTILTYKQKEKRLYSLQVIYAFAKYLKEQSTNGKESEFVKLSSTFLTSAVYDYAEQVNELFETDMEVKYGSEWRTIKFEIVD